MRLRIEQVKKFLREEQPDVLCLQETKCRDDQFPSKAFVDLGYTHLAISGQAGYHGVATVSKHPFSKTEIVRFCNKDDCRHIATWFKGGIELHNFYVPAGGDEPDVKLNEKFAHKLQFMTEMNKMFAPLGARPRAKAILVGDLNVAPREHDVWSHKQLLKVVSHTPVEVAHLDRVIDAGGWVDVARALIPENEKLYSWWSYRSKDWRASNRGRRLDHIWVTQALSKAALAAGPGSFAVHDRCRDWERPSDHAPVSLVLAL